MSDTPEVLTDEEIAEYKNALEHVDPDDEVFDIHRLIATIEARDKTIAETQNRVDGYWDAKYRRAVAEKNKRIAELEAELKPISAVQKAKGILP